MHPHLVPILARVFRRAPAGTFSTTVKKPPSIRRLSRNCLMASMF